MIADLDQTTRVLQAMLPQGTTIIGVKPLTTGFSNETYLIEGADLILRLPPSAGAMLDGHDVIAQAAIYSELGQAPGAPPVPQIVLASEDTHALGVPFFVMERVAGESIHDLDLQPWFVEGSDAFRSDIAHRWVSAFGSLARLQPLDVLGAPVSPEDDARTWRAFAAAANAPALVAQYDRLLARPAPRSGAPAVVHGDTKLSNLMWQDGKVSAVLDWEMALNGEPLADLGYMLYGFACPYHGATTPQKQPGMPDRAQVIAWWEEASGRSAEGVFWHEIAQIGKITAIIAEGTNMWLTGRSEDPKLAYFAKNLDYYLGVMTAMLDGGDF
ncbi:phosphotransferase family protein [Novosphingobium sp. JCM 18896]|uniref:phosphotransferase family protein n=1 Tax=Novosphingobium sp. JCM 18896 TaxID=2989731 RepID=UPI002223394A|nr:phosphotransferase family protein [Novosphingobium sp. JCM 18896]MCW1428378.1 phosphotransferase family protein [Novosphingobium sp. JCM 18896]